MVIRFPIRLAIGVALASVPALTQAHFILLEPAATLVQNQLGDPQKLGPCGGTSANAGMLTSVAPATRADVMMTRSWSSTT